MIRIGLGYDIHPLKAGRPLILGGVTVPSEVGLDGHSDADVLVHAVCDALLGASGRKDLGAHFPSADPSYLGKASTFFLEEIMRGLTADSWRVVNLDTVIVAQRPKLAPFLESMQKRVAGILRIEPFLVSIKAKSPEGLGALGSGDGIAAQAVALIEKSAA